MRTSIFRSKPSHFVLLLGLASLPALASDLPDPMTCGERLPKSVVIEHTGREFLAKKQTYKFTLTFDKAGTFTYSSDWGVDINKETVDGTQLRNSWQTGPLQKLALAFDGDVHCSASQGDLKECGSSLSNIIDRLEVVDQHSKAPAGSAKQKLERAALDCASSITYSSMMKSMEFVSKRLQLAPNHRVSLDRLNSDQLVAVSNRFELIKAQRDAEAEASNRAAGDAIVMQMILAPAGR